MKELKGKSKKEIMDEFVDKYEINIEEWDKMIRFIKDPNFRELEIGDIVKLKHEDKVLGIVTYINNDTDIVDIVYRDFNGVIYLHEDLDTIILDKVKKTKNERLKI